ncbi:hypothetical protein HGH90_00245 [Chitinophaga sp. Ak27]|nr:hypothetical protein [Chitinophaga sp. Ak27]
MINRSLFILILLTSIFTRMNAQHTTGQYATVNGLKMYYELHGAGFLLILIPGGGSTIQSTYSRILPLLLKVTRSLQWSSRRSVRTR